MLGMREFFAGTLPFSAATITHLLESFLPDGPLPCETKTAVERFGSASSWRGLVDGSSSRDERSTFLLREMLRTFGGMMLV